MRQIIETSGLDIGYKGKSLASGLNLRLERGVVTALIGRNGVGKSTLIKTLTGHLKPLAGRITIDGRPLENLSRKDLSKLVSLVTNEADMTGGLRLSELVELGRIPYTGAGGRLSASDRKLILSALDTVGIAHKADSFVSELSDGERQKGLIARGLVQDTPVIIMDEPFSCLDVASRLEMLALVITLARDRDKAILFSTHEVAEALRMVARIWAFLPGKVEEGSADELIRGGAIDHLFDNPNVRYNRERQEFFLTDGKNLLQF